MGSPMLRRPGAAAALGDVRTLSHFRRPPLPRRPLRRCLCSATRAGDEPPPPRSSADGNSSSSAEARAQINERLARIRRENEELRRAISAFIGAPAEKGVVTGLAADGKSWDEDAALELVRQLRAPMGAAAASPEVGASEQQQQDDGGDSTAAPSTKTTTATPVVVDAPPPLPPVPAVTPDMLHARLEQLEREGADQAAAAAVGASATPALQLPPARVHAADDGVAPDSGNGRSSSRGVTDATATATTSSSTSRLNLVFVAAEAAPYSKTGGLGDVLGALPPALAARGHRVMVVSPAYGPPPPRPLAGAVAATAPLATLSEPAALTLSNEPHRVTYRHERRAGVDWVLVEHDVYRRGGLYGGASKEDGGRPYDDNLTRFALLCLAALEAPLQLPLPPVDGDDGGAATPYGERVLFVANDWHAALVPFYLASRYRTRGLYSNARTALAIHNLAHQGEARPGEFWRLGVGGEWRGALEWAPPRAVAAHKGRRRDRDGGSNSGSSAKRLSELNALKAGIEMSDVLLTVSQAYAAEITSSPQPRDADVLLAPRSACLRGIVNGADTAAWDPRGDVHLPRRYGADDDVQRGKAFNKDALQRELRLSVDPGAPLLVFVGRLDDQKGVDLLLDALPYLAALDCQLVVLGSGAPELEAALEAAAAPGAPHSWFLRARVGFDEPLAHRLLGAADILLMPSRFEPCGLTQLYAMRYGTVPVAASTGGLADTIDDYNPFACSGGGDDCDTGTGWTFAVGSVPALVDAVRAAVRVYREQPDAWAALRARGMAKDVGWECAAEQWERVLAGVEAGVEAAGAASGAAAAVVR